MIEVWILVVVVVMAVGVTAYFSLRALKAQTKTLEAQGKYDAMSKKLSTFLAGMTSRRNVKTIDSDVRKLRLAVEDLSGDMSSIMLKQFRAALKGIKGELGEWVVAQQIQGEYDRLVYIGGAKPIDFLGISSNGVDFIEVKAGKSANLTKGERLLQQHIQAGRVHYRLIHLEGVIPQALDEKSETELLARVEQHETAAADRQKGKTTLAINEGYCRACRGPKEIKDGSIRSLKNGARLLQGECVDCGHTVTRFLKKT